MNSKLIVENLEKAAALKIFSLKQAEFDDLSREQFLKLWKQLLVANHPDKGGSTEATQNINAAKDVLLQFKRDRTTKTGKKAYDRTWWAELDKKYKTMGLHIKNELKNIINYGKYTKYFNEFFGETFSYKVTGEYPIESTMSNIHDAWIDIEFITKDRKIVLKLHLSVRLLNLVNNSGLSSPNNTYTVNVTSTGVYNNKNFKVHKKSYTSINTKSFYDDPTILYPKNKMKLAVKSTEIRKFKRADMIAGLTKTLQARWDGEYARMTVGDNDAYDLTIYRGTFMGSPFWGINGLYSKKTWRRVSMLGVFTFPEHPNTLEVYKKIINSVKKMKDENAIINKIVHILKTEHAKKSTWN